MDAPSCANRAADLDRLDVRGRRALGTLLGLVAHLRALGQRLVAVALDCAVVYEQILAGVIGRDESEALLIAEPFDGSCCHVFLQTYVRCDTRRVL